MDVAKSDSCKTGKWETDGKPLLTEEAYLEDEGPYDFKLPSLFREPENTSEVSRPGPATIVSHSPVYRFNGNQEACVQAIRQGGSTGAIVYLAGTPAGDSKGINWNWIYLGSKERQGWIKNYFSKMAREVVVLVSLKGPADEVFYEQSVVFNTPAKPFVGAPTNDYRYRKYYSPNFWHHCLSPFYVQTISGPGHGHMWSHVIFEFTFKQELRVPEKDWAKVKAITCRILQRTDE